MLQILRNEAIYSTAKPRQVTPRQPAMQRPRKLRTFLSVARMLRPTLEPKAFSRGADVPSMLGAIVRQTRGWMSQAEGRLYNLRTLIPGSSKIRHTAASKAGGSVPVAQQVPKRGRKAGPRAMSCSISCEFSGFKRIPD